jgi:hypothetical protein
MVFSKLHRNLDPVDTLGEIIFGLIMVMTFTIGARILGADEPTDGRELLIAALGCNIAWGIIDGFLFLLVCVFERRRIASLHTALAQSESAAGLQLVRDELDSELTELGDAGDRERFYAAIAAAARRTKPGKVKVTLNDVRGAALACCLVIATAIPAALPFMFISDAYIALRVSNAILACLLFLVGFRWGKHIGSPSPALVGLLIMSVGVALVLIAIPLGG